MACNNDTVEVLARALSGVAVFGPLLLPRATAVADLRAELLKQLVPKTGGGVLRVLLECDSKIVENSYKPHGDVFECTVLFRLEHLSAEERCSCVNSLRKARYRVPWYRSPFGGCQRKGRSKCIGYCSCFFYEARDLAVAECFSSFSDVARADADLAAEAVGFSWRTLEFVDPKLQARQNLVQKAIKSNGLAIKFSSPELRGDRKLVLRAARQNPEALAFASLNLLKDRKLVLEVVCRHPEAVAFAPLDLLKDRTFQVDAVDANEGAKGHIPVDFIEDDLLMTWIDDGSEVPNQIDRTEALRKVRSDGMWLASAEALRCANYSEIQNDRNIALAAVEQNPEALKYTTFTDDYEVVLAAVRGDGKVLEFASVDLRRDHQIVCSAVFSNPRARRFAIDRPLFNVSELDAKVEAASTKRRERGTASHRQCRKQRQRSSTRACHRQKGARS